MTRIGRTGGDGMQPTPSQEVRHELDSRSRQLSDGKQDTLRDGLNRGMDMERFELGAGLSQDRHALFRDKVRRALGDGEADESNFKASAQASDEDERAYLLIAMRPAMPLLPGAGPDEAARAGDAVSGKTDSMTRLVERIEQAFRAEPGGNERPAGAGISLRLDFEDVGGIPCGVTLKMTDTSIDVILSPANAGEPGTYEQMAQELADRLQARFSRRNVRILETRDELAGKTLNGLDEISRLMTDQRRTS